MKCNVCGRQTANEQANFCEYCGGSFREHMQNSFNTPPQQQGFPYPNESMPGMMPNQGYGIPGAPNPENEKPVSFLNWLGTYGLFLIPFAGWLIFFIMLFIWAFSGNTPDSKKNWARATLIFTVVMIILIIAYLFYFFIKNGDMIMKMSQDMQNGTFDYNSYYNNLFENNK